MCNSESAGISYGAMHQSQAPFVPQQASYCEGSGDSGNSLEGSQHGLSNSTNSERPFSLTNPIRLGASGNQQHVTKFEPESHSPEDSTGPIVSDNGLQYANLDGSSPMGYPHHPAYNPHAHPHHGISHQAIAAVTYGQYSANETIISGGTEAIAASGDANPNASAFSAYLENSNVTAAQQYASAAVTTHSYSSLYHQPKLRSSHEYSPYVAKPASNVPTYKWMQVKRNVPKPGKILQHLHLLFF